MTVDFSGVYLTVNEHGGIYTVCTEGELFYAPMYQDGSVNLEEFDIIDFWDSEIDAEELEEIQKTLCKMMQVAGLIMIALPNPTRMITFMETFKVILSLQSNPDKFTFTTIEDCSDMDECIEFIHDHFPLHNIESIRRIPQS
jgi:hypothetical protein